MEDKVLEITHMLNDYAEKINKNPFSLFGWGLFAKELYDKNCRIISDDMVLITKEEYEALKAQTLQCGKKSCEEIKVPQEVKHEPTVAYIKEETQE